ncbi:MAG TPA: pyridoxal phosphate-dependent aminotransferase [Candidatus Polarisedimenticolaceae bacterium]|nr:pyridoxal phosphate-dependent aminotransferase [Candidatus Polarisedimenticolaceae bacterium]
MIAARVGQIVESATLRLAEQAEQMRLDGIDVVDLTAGQPDFPTPDAAAAGGKRAIDEHRTRYTATAGIGELREAIAARLASEAGVPYAPAQVLVSPGAKASLYFAALALFDPGDEVLIPTPFWVSYPEQVRLAAAAPVFVSCAESHGFKLQASDLERAITPRTKAVILNYPANPTGACYRREELEPLADVCTRRGLWVLSDEIYSKLIFDGRPFHSIARLGTMAERTVIVGGMSKSYSMTGWRIGFAAGPAAVIAAMEKLQSHVTSNATSISQWASLAALRDGEQELAARVAEFQSRRDAIVAGLNAIPGIRCVRPEGTFYAFPNVSGCFRPHGVASGEQLAARLLERARVAVVPGEAFGSAEHVRLSFATSRSRIDEGLRRIAAELGGVRGD